MVHSLYFVLYVLSRVLRYSNMGGCETCITVECNAAGTGDVYYNRIRDIRVECKNVEYNTGGFETCIRVSSEKQ